MRHTTRAHIEGGHAANFERFAQVGDPDECWHWTGPHDEDGYGTSRATSRGERNRTGAHRVAYLLLHGSIDPDLILDHLCRNRWCVNPNHLEAVTNHENTLRQRLGGMCRAGLHEMVEENVQWNKAKTVRRCRACNYASTRAANRRWRARRRASAA